MKTIPVIAQLRSTDERDSRAPYVYLEITRAHARTILHARRLCTAARGLALLALLSKVTRVAIDGPLMEAIETLPPLTAEQKSRLEEDECIVLSTPIPQGKLGHCDVRLCCEELHLFSHGGLYAIANDKHSRDIYEANLSAIIKCLSGLSKQESPDRTAI